METLQHIPTSTQFTDDDEGGLQLGQVIAALKRRLLLIAGVTAVVTIGAVFKALTDTPIYEAQFEILTQPTTLENRIISTASDDGLSQQEDLLGSALDEVKLQILRSPRLLEPTLEQLQVLYPSMTYLDLVSGLSLNVKSDRILIVKFTNENKKLVEDTLAQLAEDYINYSVDNRQSGIYRGIIFVDDQLPLLRDRVDLLQDSLQNLRQKYNLVDPVSQGEELTTQVNSLRQQQLEINLQLQESTQTYAALQREVLTNGIGAVAPSLQDDARYQQILNQLLALDIQLAEQSVLLRETSPEIQHILEQKQSLAPILAQEGERVQRQISNLIENLSIRSQILGQAIEDLNLQIKELSGVTREYSDIQRELEIATTILNEFRSQREVLQIEGAQQQAPWEILTEARPPRASVASAQQNFVLGIILGLILGSGVALAVDKLSSLVRTVADLKDELPFPLLGVIPFNPALAAEEMPTMGQVSQSKLDALFPKQKSAADHPELGMRAFSEAFRSLSTNLQLMTLDKTVHALTISSSSPNEGKTTVSINLAQTLALMGRKVLLVDTDLRRPSLHRRLGLTNEYGLMDVIVSDADLQAIIQPSLISPNLFVLTSGAIPPDPPTVLASSVMSAFHQQAREEFDLVLYDAPPMLGFADAYLTAALTRNLVVVVGVGNVKRSQLQQLMESLQVPDIKVLGTVANGVTESSVVSYNYYNYYSSEAKAGN